MEEENLPLGRVVGTMMQEMFRVLKKRAADQMDIVLTIEQSAVLHMLSSKKSDVILKEMACAMGKDKSAILRIIDVLEKKGLVRRAPDQKDRRKKYLMVTKAGEAVIEKSLEIEAELRAELQQGIADDEMKTFYNVIRRMKAKAEQL